MIVKLKNEAGLVKKVPVGFSWTMLIFGPFVPLFRGDLKWTILFLSAVIFTLPFYGLGWFVLPFIYNKRYIMSLLERGYKPMDEESRILLANKGIILPNKEETK